MNANTKNAITNRFAKFWLMLPTALLISSFTLLGDGPKSLKIGKSMPAKDTTLISVDGDTTSLDLQMGSNGLIVIFSCNTCPFVVGNDSFDGWERQYNDLNQMAKQINVNTVLVNSNEAKRPGVDSIEEMKNRSEEKGYTMPYLLDKDHVVADAFGAKTTPHIFFFDKNQKLIYSGSIDNTWDNGRTEDILYLANAIELYGQGKKLDKKTTQPRGCSIKRTIK